MNAWDRFTENFVKIGTIFVKKKYLSENFHSSPIFCISTKISVFDWVLLLNLSKWYGYLFFMMSRCFWLNEAVTISKIIPPPYLEKRSHVFPCFYRTVCWWDFILISCYIILILILNIFLHVTKYVTHEFTHLTHMKTAATLMKSFETMHTYKHFFYTYTILCYMYSLPQMFILCIFIVY